MQLIKFQKISSKRILWYLVSIVFCLLLVPYFRSLFVELGLRWLYIFLFSLLISYILTPVMRLIALKLNIVDMPGRRKIHEKSVPLLGGGAIVIAFISALLANMILERDIIVLLYGGIFVFLVSLADDYSGMSARLKLLAQIFVVLVLIYHGIILDLFPPKTYWGYWLNFIFTIIWIVGITNAMNFIDGMDGLAAGVSAIIAFFMGIVAFQTNQPFMGWIAVAMLGSCLGFLPFNFRFKEPASIFLGDAGSTFLGFILAALAVKGDWADNNPIVSFSAPVLIFWILIFDMAYITAERILTGKVKNFREWIDYVGKDHLHHRMHALLGDKRKAVFLIYLLCATLSISAVALRNARPVDGMLLVFQAFLITIIISIIEYSGRHNTFLKKD